MSDNPFNASWSSKGNTLCLGHWDITYLGLPVVLPLERRCIQPLNMRNIKTNRDWAGIFGNKRDEYR